jgi:hypothetical protein
MISKDKKYKLRMDGEVELFEVNNEFSFGKYRVTPCSEWNASRWSSKNGCYQVIGESLLDLIEISPYADFKIDDKVLVWNNPSTKSFSKVKAHFSGIDSENKPMTFNDGTTKFTHEYCTSWNYCEKYEEQND